MAEDWNARGSSMRRYYILFFVLIFIVPCSVGSQINTPDDECYLNPDRPCLFNLALKSADEIYDFETRVAIVGDLLHVQSATGYTNEIETIINRLIKEASKKSDPYWKARYFTAIAILQSKLALKNDALKSIGNAQINAEKIKNMRIDAPIGVFADIAVARKMNGDHAGAKADFGKLIGLAKRQSNALAQTFCFVNIGVGLAKSGDISAARAIVESTATKTKWCKSILIHGLGEIELIAGNLNIAREHIIAASNIIRKTRPYSGGEGFIHAEVVSNIATALAQVGMVQEARVTAKKIMPEEDEYWVMKRIQSIDEAAKSDLSVQKVKVIAGSGDIRAAANTAKAIKIPASRAKALNAIIKALPSSR